MALPIRDGNQSLTTLSTILVSNSHIPAHTVISFGTQGITDIATAVSGVELGPNTLNALENITVTLGQVTITGGLTDTQLRASAVTIGGSVTATISGTASVTFGSASILNFPATQTVTFTQAPVTFGTAVITGSTSIIGTPSVTFTTAPVTFGTALVTGSTSILNFPATQTVTFSQAPVTFGIISGTVTANPTGTQTIAGSVTLGAGTAQIGSVTASISGTVPISISSVTIGNSVTIGSLPAISGTVTANLGQFALLSGLGAGIASEDEGGIPYYGVQIGYADAANNFAYVRPTTPLPISGTVTANVIGFNYGENEPAKIPIKFDISDNFYIPIGPSTDPIPLLTYGTVTVGNSVTIGSALPAGTNRIGVVTIGAGTVTIGAGTAQIGSVTASISGTVTIFPVQGTSVTTSNFTSTTPSQTIASASSGREILTIFNEGAGNLHVCAGSTCTTIGYQVRLSSGDYWECPASQVQLIHTAVFATTGTARVTEIG